MLDKSLVDLILQKKDDAFTVFYNMIVDHFYNYLKSNFSLSESDIHDIISNTFIKIWNNLDSFDKKKWNFTSWVWTILRNTTKDFFKKKNEYVFSDFDFSDKDGDVTSIEEFLEDDNNYNDVLENDYQLEQISEAIKNLKLSERELLFLRYTEWKSLKEIAQIVGLTETNVRVKIHRLLGKLKKYLNWKK